MQICLLRLSEGKLPSSIEQNFLRFLDFEEREKILKFRNYDDFKRSLCGEVLAKYMLAKKLEINPLDVHFLRTEYGKPFITSKLKFNTSHSGQYIACAVHSNEIGIDVEILDSFQPHIVDQNFINYVYSYEEQHQIYASPNKGHLMAKFWVLKESYLKAIGIGLVNELNEISFCLSDDEITCNKKGNFTVIDIGQQAVLAICEIF